MDAEVYLDDPLVLTALQRLVDEGGNLSAVSKQIGEYLVFSTKRRFQTSTDPKGNPWKENSEVTLIKFLNKTKGNFNKGGGLSSRGRKRAGNKKPLIGESGSFSTTIAYNAASEKIEVGTPMIYGGVAQHGAKKGAFGSNKKGVPIPWGDIPARAFLGLSLEDRMEVLAIIGDHHKKLLSR